MLFYTNKLIVSTWYMETKTGYKQDFVTQKTHFTVKYNKYFFILFKKSYFKEFFQEQIR